MVLGFVFIMAARNMGKACGYRMPLNLLPFVRYVKHISTYSWGSACLAYLYRRLCSAGIGYKTELCGSMTLLQVIDTLEIPIKTIIPLINNEHNHIVGYKKAWRGKQITIEEVYGSWATTYQALPMFLAAIMKTNPGTIAEINVVPHAKERGTSVCKRIFWSLKAMMDGWQHARPVISIDGTFLKERYRGKLLIALGVDSNNHPYPLCYGLVDEETYENWPWFLQRLRRYVCRQRTGVCIISDRASSIISALRDPQNGFVEPLDIHSLCLLHVRSNFCSHHPDGELKKLMWKAGRTTQVSKHDAYMSRIGEISPTALQYLATIPVERWTLSHDSGVRYG
ncbi:uncharacterized protein LOC141714439 [Apium graveolens]|uniref:uncharacterized protein LOC141714439 n=1 Tax=Apium graveolens TaxID=4045 RepID=UPI003D7BC28C